MDYYNLINWNENMNIEFDGFTMAREMFEI